MSLVRIKEAGGIDSFVNKDYVEFIQAVEEKHTRVWLNSGKVFDVEEAVDKVAKFLGWPGDGTAWVGNVTR